MISSVTGSLSFSYIHLTLTSRATNGLSTDTPNLQLTNQLHRHHPTHNHARFPRVHLTLILLDPPRLLSTPPMVRTRRPDLHDPTRIPHRSLLSDPKKPRLFSRQLPHLHILGPRFLSPLSPYLSPRSPLSPRRVDFPLPFPTVQSASRHSRPHVLRSRDLDRSLALNSRRRFPHHRRIAPHLGVDGRLRDRVRTRCVQSSRGSLPRRSRASEFRIALLPRRRCLFRRRGRRSCRRTCLRGGRK